MLAILFTARWCGPCHQMEPITAEVFEKLGDYYTLERVDVDRNPELAERWVIRQLPTLLVVADGREQGRLIGLQTRIQLIRWLENVNYREV